MRLHMPGHKGSGDPETYDIDILVSVKVDCNQHFIEELACSADKGLALKVLVFSGTLAYEHYLGVRSAHSDNNVGSCLAQLAFLAVCAGVIYACIERIKEIKGGELDEARHY